MCALGIPCQCPPCYPPPPGAPHGAVLLRDLPARPGCAGSSRPCSARRGRPGARGAAVRPPTPSPRSRRRRQLVCPVRTACAPRTSGAGPACPPPAPWPALPPAAGALRSRRCSAAPRGRGRRGEAARGERRLRRKIARQARPGMGGGAWRPQPARPPQHPAAGPRAGHPAPRPHPDTLSTFLAPFCPQKTRILLNRICADSNSPGYRLWFLCQYTFNSDKTYLPLLLWAAAKYPKPCLFTDTPAPLVPLCPPPICLSTRFLPPLRLPRLGRPSPR